MKNAVTRGHNPGAALLNSKGIRDLENANIQVEPAPAQDQIETPDSGMELPWKVGEDIASWQRIMAGARDENIATCFGHASRELRALADTQPPEIKQFIIDALHNLATASGISPDDAQAIMTDRQTVSAKVTARFALIPFADIKVDIKARNYLVKDLLANSGLAVIWGPPKCGKSFWAMDLGLHIALGWPYRGRKVQQAPVVYVALEGQHGFPGRIEGFRRHHSVTAAPFFLVTSRLNLIADAKQLVVDIKAQIGSVMPGIVFIDTLNRSLVGSESKDEDMGRYLAAAELVASELSCAVAIVHHCGINESRPRGHTSLTGSVESQLAVRKADGRKVVVKVEYAKDFREGDEIASQLVEMAIGIDADGDKISTLVVLPSDDIPVKTKERGLSEQPMLAKRYLADIILDHGAPSLGVPPGLKGVPVEHWREECYRRGLGGQEKAAQRKAFNRAKDKLTIAAYIAERDGIVWQAKV